MAPVRDRAVAGALVGVAALVYLPYLVHGVGFVQDDWWGLGHAHFDGAWRAAGPDQLTARPGAAVVYAFLFGAIGRHPLAVLGVLAVLDAVGAVLLHRLLRRFVPSGVAALAAVLWLVLPNHTTTETWASAANISVSFVAMLAGLLLLIERRTVFGLLALAFAVLCYEACIPVAVAALLVLPPLRRVRWAGLAAVALPALWIVTHWHPAKKVAPWTTDVVRALPGHFGWGIVPDGLVATVLLLAAVAGIVVAARRQEWTVLAGVAVIGLSVLPFVRYAYEPIGVGDRVMFVSAAGGALAWAGIVAMTAQWRAVVARALLVLLLGGAVVARWQRADAWGDAASTAVAVVDEVVADVPEPDGPLLVDPLPGGRFNIAAFGDISHLRLALALAYDDPDIEVLVFP